MRTIGTLLIFVFSPLLLAAQENRLLVLGTITSASDNKAIEGVVILCKSPSRISQSDKQGHYAILIDNKAGSKLEFHIVGFDPLTAVITPDLLKTRNGDTLRLNVQLHPAAIVLPEAHVTSGPDTVIGNWKFFIEDYEFMDDTTIVLLTFENSLKKAKVMITGPDEKIRASADVPAEAIELMKDYHGSINVMCKDSAFRVKIVPPDKVLLLALPYTDFCARIVPCVDTSGGRILFSNYHREYPAFSYYAYDPADTSFRLVHYVVDKELLAQYDWEFDYLKPKDRLYARKMEAYTGIDKRVIAATMTGFPESIYYTPLYAPLYVVHDTTCVFDHYSDSIFLFDRDQHLIGASHIDYHHPKNWKDWDRQMYKDEITGEIYAQFENGGTITLKKIDIHTGKIVGEFKLTNHYPKQLHIRDGYVYYVYRPFESVQKKYIYRERIDF